MKLLTSLSIEIRDLCEVNYLSKIYKACRQLYKIHFSQGINYKVDNVQFLGQMI